MGNIGTLIKRNTMLIALVVITVLFQISTKGTLLAPQNVTNLLSQNGYVLILAVGMLMCILTGGNIDLSVGSVVALVGAFAGKLIVTMGMNIYLAMGLSLIMGAVIGIWHGYWIAYVRIPAFIVTLAGMLIWRGAALMLLAGLTISPFPPNYLSLFNNFVPDILGGGGLNITCLAVGAIIAAVYIAFQIRGRNNKIKKGYQTEEMSMLITRSAVVVMAIGAFSYSLARYRGIPVILILLAVVIAAYSYFTSKTVPGRHLYAVGGNEKAARLSGINTDKVLFMAYANMGFLAALTALVCVARFNSAAPTAGQNYELDAIGSCFIGGASAYGGTGTVGGAVIGAIFMGVINNGMSIMGIDTNVQRLVKGLVLLAAVAFDIISRKRGKSA